MGLRDLQAGARARSCVSARRCAAGTCMGRRYGWVRGCRVRGWGSECVDGRGRLRGCEEEVGGGDAEVAGRWERVERGVGEEGGG